MAVCAAFDTGIVEHDIVAVSGRLDIDIGDIGAEREGAADRFHGVFEIGMGRRQHPVGLAPVQRQSPFVEALAEPEMRDQARFAGCAEYP